jgi:DNA mismatch repair protein MutS2
LLDSIHRARDQAEAEMAVTQQERAKAGELRATLKKRLRDVDLERLRILQDARIEARAELESLREEIRRLRRQLSAAGKPLTEIRRLQHEVATLTKQATSEPEPLPVVTEEEPGLTKRPVKVGDTVWLSTLQVEGQVLSLDETQAEVSIGRLRIRASLDELEWRRSQPPRAPERELPQSLVGRASQASVELDLRGERVETALQRLESFLDAGLLSNVPWVRIIHGKGTGRLRSAVRGALKTSPHVVRFEDGKDGEGGWGVTVAHLGT